MSTNDHLMLDMLNRPTNAERRARSKSPVLYTEMLHGRHATHTHAAPTTVSVPRRRSKLFLAPQPAAPPVYPDIDRGMVLGGHRMNADAGLARLETQYQETIRKLNDLEHLHEQSEARQKASMSSSRSYPPTARSPPPQTQPQPQMLHPSQSHFTQPAIASPSHASHISSSFHSSTSTHQQSSSVIDTLAGTFQGQLQLLQDRISTLEKTLAEERARHQQELSDERQRSDSQLTEQRKQLEHQEKLLREKHESDRQAWEIQSKVCWIRHELRRHAHLSPL